MKHIILMSKAEITRQVILFKRYPFEPISSLIVVAITFLVLCFSVDISTSGESANIADLLIRFILGMLSMYMISVMGINVAGEAKVGTLERIYTMPSRLFSVITIRNFVALFYNIAQLSIFVLVTIFIMKIDIGLNSGMFLLLATFIVSLLGVGYILSGLTLIFKRTGDVAQLLQFLFLFMALIPYDKFPTTIKYLTGYFPGAMAVQLLNRSDSITLFDIDFIIALMYASSHLFIGIVLFKYFEKTAVNKGLLGKY